MIGPSLGLTRKVSGQSLEGQAGSTKQPSSCYCDVTAAQLEAGRPLHLVLSESESRDVCAATGAAATGHGGAAIAGPGSGETSLPVARQVPLTRRGRRACLCRGDSHGGRARSGRCSLCSDSAFWLGARRCLKMIP